MVILIRAVRAELLKALTLPMTWIAAALAVALPVVVEYSQVNGMVDLLEAGEDYSLSVLPDMGLQSLMYAVAGAIVLGTGIAASEYHANAQTVGFSRQLTTTLLTCPRRGIGMTAKLVVVLVLTFVLAVVAQAATLSVTKYFLGSWAQLDPLPWGRLAALVMYWQLCALAGAALATATREALMPLVVLVTVTTVVAPSIFLTKLTDLVRFLPDAAASRLVLHSTGVDLHADMLSAPQAVGACVAWAALCVAYCYAFWVRRDA